ncbi:MAG: nuclear transport factor 2 family protein [Steroidobacteraceae bacterium]
MRNGEAIHALRLAALLAAVLAGGCAAVPGKPAPVDVAAVRQEVEATERAFARTMAARDLVAFTAFIAEDAVFIEDPEPLRGRDQVVAGWKVLYAKPEAPFSWEPERVEVLASGRLALTTGPVHDPRGKLIGTFTSIWRREPDGRWRIVFDRGNAACDCAGK